MIRLWHASRLARMIYCCVFANSLAAAIAADPPASSSNAASASNGTESAVLKRIQNNWRARGEQFKSYHFAWDSQSVLPAHRGEAVAVTHCEYWFQGSAGKAGTSNAKYRIHTTLTDPRLKPGVSGDEWQLTFDGTTTCTFDSDDRVGTVHSGYWGFDRVSIEPLVFAMQPASQQVIDPSSNKLRVIGDNAYVGQRRCLKLRQDHRNFTFHCWVDPEREDVIAGWERLVDNQPLDFFSIEYKREHNEWLPSRWTETTHSIPGNPSTISSVTKSATNEKFSERTFVLEFPPGAVVLDTKRKQNYVIQKDGTRRPLSADALRLYEALEQAVDFTIDPEPLKDALAFIAQRYQIKVTIDPEATRKGLIDPAIEVQTKTAAFQLKRVLKLLLAQSQKPLTWKVRDGGLLIVPASRPN
jgi:hypothetical protein